MAAIYPPVQWPRQNLHPLPRLKALVEVKPVRPNIKNVERNNKKNNLASTKISQNCSHSFSKPVQSVIINIAAGKNEKNKQKGENHIFLHCPNTDNIKHIAVINESLLFFAIRVPPWRLRPWVIAQINTDLRKMEYIFNT